jgi:endonuclease/exonuclease/phosphatase (EEP) superfamily protein YafD
LKRTLSALRLITFAVALVYALGIALYLGLRAWLGDSTWWMGFLNNFTTWYFMPAFALLIVAGVLRAKRALLVTLPVVIIALFFYAPYVMPKARAAVPDDTPRLRMVTFNVWGGNDVHAASTGFNAIGDWLRTLDADVILLQEVPLSQRTREDGILGLRALYPEQHFAETDLWTNATLTRLPVIEHVSEGMDGGRPRFQRTVVEIDGVQIAVYNIHNAIPFREERRFTPPIENFMTNFAARYDPTWRDMQVDFLLDTLAQEPLPYIVGGDFNMSDQSLIYNDLAAVMTDSFRSAGWGFGKSWRADVERGGRGLPALIRIDYIWHSAAFASLASEQGPFLGSDHIGLVSTLTFTQR